MLSESVVPLPEVGDCGHGGSGEHRGPTIRIDLLGEHYKVSSFIYKL